MLFDTAFVMNRHRRGLNVTQVSPKILREGLVGHFSMGVNPRAAEQEIYKRARVTII